MDKLKTQRTNIKNQIQRRFVEIDEFIDTDKPEFELDIEPSYRLISRTNTKTFEIFDTKETKELEMEAQKSSSFRIENFKALDPSKIYLIYCKPTIFLGEGRFSTVVQGEIYLPEKIDCAIKRLNIGETCLECDILEEFKDSKYIIKVLGKFDEKMLKIDHSIETGSTEEPRWLIVYELADGNLLDRISDKKCSSTQILRWSFQLAQALHELQSKSIVHHDIKPHNILMFGENIKLADFGYAEREECLTDGRGKGTPAYTAPEILSGKYSKSVDIYSFGATLYHLAFRRSPFHGTSSPIHMILMIKKGFYECGMNPLDYEKGCISFMDGAPIPGEFVKMMIRCVDIVPSNRPTSQDILEVLQGLIE